MVDVKLYSKFRLGHFWMRQTVVTWLHTTLRKPVSRSLWVVGWFLTKSGFHKTGLNLLLKGRRIASISGSESTIRRLIERDLQGRRLESLLVSVEGRNAGEFAGRVLILKTPVIRGNEVVEKGALIVKFTETCGALYQLLDVHLLAEYFRVILEPSWVGYSLAELLVWCKLSPEKVVVLSPYEDDFEFLSRLDLNLVPIVLGPADWVDPETFKEAADSQKEYDSIYVANFDPLKRVDRYLRAVVRVTRLKSDFKAALVCARHGTARQEILDTIGWAQSRANVSFFTGMRQKDLNELVNKAKVNVLASLREGANKGLAEGLFAGVPALLIAECACGNHRHINALTGRVVPDASLESALLWFSENYGDFSPREWAMKNISPSQSVRRLSETLREIEVGEGRAWTKDLYAKVNMPELDYLDPHARRLLSERSALLHAFERGCDRDTAMEFLRNLAQIDM
jgi:glycosyltransferase involved in cell wall biosynthesis